MFIKYEYMYMYKYMNKLSVTLDQVVIPDSERETVKVSPKISCNWLLVKINRLIK